MASLLIILLTLIKYVQGLKLGSKVKVTYTTDDKEKTATGKIIKIANGKNGIGIGLTDHTEVKSPENVKLNLMVLAAQVRVLCYLSYLRSGVWIKISRLVVRLLEQEPLKRMVLSVISVVPTLR